MLSRIHVYAASLGLLLAGPAIAVGQSSQAVMLDRASAAVLPSYEVRLGEMTLPYFRGDAARLSGWSA